MKDFMKNALTTISNITGRASLKIQKYSPEIALAAGIVGIGGTIFLACKATLRAEEVLERHNTRMEQAKEAAEVATPEDNYDIGKEKTAVYTHTVVDFVKLYAPAVGLGIFSISMILVSHHVLKTRYLGAVAAFETVSAAFEKYRTRVRAKYGEDDDRYFRYGIVKEEREVEEVDENGEVVKKTETVEKVTDQLMPSEYARFFDESNPNWDRTPTYSLMFLRCQQNTANDILQSRGHLFLNEVYDLLGFEHTPVGAVTGWIKGSETGDSYVDFGLYDVCNEKSRAFINGDVNVFLIDPNVDGVIFDKI